MKEFQSEKKNLIVLDFDNIIYYNPSNNFTIEIDFCNILPANYFFTQLASQVELFASYDFAHNTHFVLITGRPSRQKDLILLYLRKRGYQIDEAYFSNYDPAQISRITEIFDESDFLLKYWTGKVDLITRLSRSRKYNSITIIDDSNVICSMLKELNFTVIRAEIQRLNAYSQIRFHPFNQQSNLKLLEQEVIIHG